MKKLILILSISFFSLSAQAQWAVTDAGSISQRLALFLQEINEIVSQTADISEQATNSFETLQLARESVEKLQQVSNFIKSSKELLELSQASVRIADKLVDYKERIMQLSNLGEEQKLWVLSMATDIAAEAASQAAEGMKLAKSGTDGEFSDYERLQIIKGAKNIVLNIENSLDNLYTNAANYSNYTGMMNSFRSFALDVATLNN